jgi:O-antigen/teichoic acid export membrane protein
MSLKAKAIKGVKLNTISTTLNIVVQTAQIFIIAKILSPEQFGLMSLLLIVIRFSDIFFEMGLTNAIIQRRNITDEQVSTLHYFNFVVGAVILIILLLLSYPLSQLFGQPSLKKLIPLLSIVYIIIPFGQQYKAFLQKKLEFSILTKIEILSTMSAFLIITITVWLGFGVISLVYSQLFSVLLRTALLVYYGRRIIKVERVFRFSKIRDIISFGLYQTGENILNFLNSNIDSLAIGKINGAAPLGFYNIAYSLIIVPSTRINPIVMRVFFPYFSEIQNLKKKLTTDFYKLLKILNLINFPLFVGLFLLAEPMIYFCFGARWIEAVLLIKILCGVGLLKSIGNSFGILLYALGHAKRMFNFNLFKTAISVPSIVVAAYYGGAIGVAVVFLVLQLIFFSMSYHYLINYSIGNTLNEYLGSILIPLKNCFIMFFCILSTQMFLSREENWIKLFVGVIIGISSYMLTLYFSKDKLIREIITLGKTSFLEIVKF